MKADIATFLAVLLTSAVPTFGRNPSHQDGRSRWRDCPDCSTMIVVPTGSFTMGSLATEPGHKPDEEPATEVTVQSFAMTGTDVTRS